tara:strand:+ start:466 stop:693 length:228 start_codon:yes stop_codon:yes gene_type:complete
LLRNVVVVRNINSNGNTIRIKQRKMDCNISAGNVSMITIIKNGIPVCVTIKLKWLNVINLKEDIITTKELLKNTL